MSWAWQGGGAVGRLVAAEGAEGLVERWRDLGPTMWAVAAGAALLWVVAYGLLYAWTEPRRVPAGPGTLDLVGPEPPAVVNLVTHDWELGHEAVPATLLDLAARKHLVIDQVGEETLVRVPPPRPEPLTDYERMVMDHVRGLARRTDTMTVPAQALTTGPDNDSARWWARFGAHVAHDAQRRGLSRDRWPAAAKAVLVALAAAVALALALAVSTLADDADDPDDDPLGGAVGAGVGGFASLSIVASRLGGQRDTPAGRACAARWLGLGETLGDNPLFAEHPPAGVAIWDRHLGYGAALGVAHGAVARLPLGAESEREAWSSWGGRWRVVKVRYPNAVPPGYGHHPLLVAAWGAAQLGVGAFLLPQALSLADATLDTGSFDTGAVDGDGGVAEAAGRVFQVVSGVLATLLALVAVIGAWLLFSAVVDLVSGRRDVTGVVLRRKVRRGDKKVVATHLAVDDGTTDHLRAWRLRGVQAGGVGQVVRGRVTRRLAHVADFEVVPHQAPPGPHQAPPGPGGTAAATGPGGPWPAPG